MVRIAGKKRFIPLLWGLIFFSFTSYLYAEQWCSRDVVFQDVNLVLLRGPINVTIIGMFPPAQGTVKKGLVKLTVIINKVRKDFIVQDLWPRGSNMGTLEILNQILPPVLRFYGPKEILENLLKPETQGKVLRMVGDLYLSSGIFLIDFEEEQTKK